jgi:putative transposase
MPGSYSYVGGDTAKDERVRVCWISERKSSQIIFERWANARFKYRSRSFWCRGYYVDTVGKNTKKITEYIQNQLKEDQVAEQLELEMEDPFTGTKK